MLLLMLQYFVLYYFFINSGTVQTITKILVSAFYIFALNIIIKRNKVFFVFTYLISIIIFLINLLFFKNNTSEILPILFPFFFMCIPSFIYSYGILNRKTFEYYTEKIGILIYIIGILVGILIYMGRISIENYSMSYSYYLLLPTVIFLKKFFDTFSIKYAALFSVSLILILTYGSRGPILALSVFVILYQLINLKNMANFKIIGNFFFFVLLITISIFFEDITIYFNDTLSDLGIKSRTIVLLMQDEVRTSGRDKIYSNVLRETCDNPIFGNGIAGDRIINYSVKDAKYTHNIVIEILSSFGFILGSIITLFLFFISYLALFKLEKKDANFILIWFVVGFVPLLVSSSFLIYYQFWIFLGLTLNYLKIFKRNGENAI